MRALVELTLSTIDATFMTDVNSISDVVGEFVAEPFELLSIEVPFQKTAVLEPVNAELLAIALLKTFNKGTFDVLVSIVSMIVILEVMFQLVEEDCRALLEVVAEFRT